MGRQESRSLSGCTSAHLLIQVFVQHLLACGACVGLCVPKTDLPSTRSLWIEITQINQVSLGQFWRPASEIQSPSRQWLIPGDWGCSSSML